MLLLFRRSLIIGRRGTFVDAGAGKQSSGWSCEIIHRGGGEVNQQQQRQLPTSFAPRPPCQVSVIVFNAIYMQSVSDGGIMMPGGLLMGNVFVGGEMKRRMTVVI